jgi:hypothetical protein
MLFQRQHLINLGPTDSRTLYMLGSWYSSTAPYIELIGTSLATSIRS